MAVRMLHGNSAPAPLSNLSYSLYLVRLRRSRCAPPCAAESHCFVGVCEPMRAALGRLPRPKFTAGDHVLGHGGKSPCLPGAFAPPIPTFHRATAPTPLLPL